MNVCLPFLNQLWLLSNIAVVSSKIQVFLRLTRPASHSRFTFNIPCVMLTEASTVPTHLIVTRLNSANVSLLFFSKRLALLVKLGTAQVRLKPFNFGGDYQCSGKPPQLCRSLKKQCWAECKVVLLTPESVALTTKPVRKSMSFHRREVRQRKVIWKRHLFDAFFTWNWQLKSTSWKLSSLSNVEQQWVAWHVQNTFHLLLSTTTVTSTCPAQRTDWNNFTSRCTDCEQDTSQRRMTAPIACSRQWQPHQSNFGRWKDCLAKHKKIYTYCT